MRCKHVPRHQASACGKGRRICLEETSYTEKLLEEEMAGSTGEDSGIENTSTDYQQDIVMETEHLKRRRLYIRESLNALEFCPRSSTQLKMGIHTHLDKLHPSLPNFIGYCTLHHVAKIAPKFFCTFFFSLLNRVYHYTHSF